MHHTTFILVRHALKEKKAGDVPITPEGIEQAQATARHLSRMPVTAIVASPLRRAKETAEYIALMTNSAVIEDIRLRERANWGDLPGQTFEEFAAMWERCTRDPGYVPPVGDSASQAGERLSSLLSELGEKYPPGSSLVMVTHGGLITDFLVHAFADGDLNAWHPDFAAEQSALIPECSVTVLHYAGGRYTIDTFASVVHLRLDG